LGRELAVGAIGTLSGLGIGILLLAFRQPLREGLAQMTQREIFSAEVYDFYDLPARLATTDLDRHLWRRLLCLRFPPLLPAYLAARLDAARALAQLSLPSQFLSPTIDLRQISLGKSGSQEGPYTLFQIHEMLESRGSHWRNLGLDAWRVWVETSSGICLRF